MRCLLWFLLLLSPGFGCSPHKARRPQAPEDNSRAGEKEHKDRRTIQQLGVVDQRPLEQSMRRVTGHVTSLEEQVPVNGALLLLNCGGHTMEQSSDSLGRFSFMTDSSEDCTLQAISWAGRYTTSFHLASGETRHFNVVLTAMKPGVLDYNQHRRQ